MEGWYSIHRTLLNSDLWLSEKFTRGQAWVDLIGLANHKEGYIRNRGIRLAIERGQVGWSQERLSKRWKWSTGKVSRFFKELEIDGGINRQKNNVSSVITINNYDFYQSDGRANEIANERQTEGKQSTNNNVNNKKNEKNLRIINKIKNNFLKKTKMPEPNEHERLISRAESGDKRARDQLYGN
ncbi:hypothetical protein JW758_00775 [Candidatus Peregrinibacteria bacterium]|nr:hypothetical protein [Candidatus Peregrinibacteria bacterium]